MAWSPELENIHNVGRFINLDELKQIELNILKEFDAYCRSNDLKYFLAGGTLLGAIRHQGFIPWDDDIDVLMPRPDYLRFHDLTKGKLNKYTVRSIYNCPKLHTRPFIRVVDDQYMTKLSTPPFYMPPWIDIFPMDGLPDDPKESKAHFKKAKKLKWLVARSWIPIEYTTKKKHKKILKKICFLPLRLLGHNYFLRKLEQYGMQYDYDKCDYVGCVVAGGHGARERVLKSSFCKPVLMRFEDSMFIGPYDYDTYLKHLYKKYMKIPSKKARQTHLISAWEISNINEMIGE